MLGERSYWDSISLEMNLYFDQNGPLKGSTISTWPWGNGTGGLNMECSNSIAIVMGWHRFHIWRMCEESFVVVRRYKGVKRNWEKEWEQDREVVRWYSYSLLFQQWNWCSHLSYWPHIPYLNASSTSHMTASYILFGTWNQTHKLGISCPGLIELFIGTQGA